MNNQQLGFFTEDNPAECLKDLRVSVIGKISMPKKQLKEKLKKAGVKQNDKGEIQISFIKKADILVVGSNPSTDDLKRVCLNEHDGFKPIRITEEELYSILSGAVTRSFDKIVKKINITYDYYNWDPPVIKDHVFVSKVSSPVNYDIVNGSNSLAGKEIFVPDFENVNMNNFRQLIGNIGGYANNEYYDDTNVVMLSDSTLAKLKQGIKDDTILKIEDAYNRGNSDEFNVQFTCESDFIEWIKVRLERFPDESSMVLFDKCLSK